LAVDTMDVIKLGEGLKIVYTYGYKCAPDRLKIGLTEIDIYHSVAKAH
jgi:hypothetical protein